MISEIHGITPFYLKGCFPLSKEKNIRSVLREKMLVRLKIAVGLAAMLTFVL